LGIKERAVTQVILPDAVFGLLFADGYAPAE
jgi:hypothetical protein